MPAIPYIIMGGAQVISSKINSDAQGKAADAQAAAIEKGIALQEKMYEQDRADLAGYRGLGNAAVGNLAYLGGINLPAADAGPSGPTPSANPVPPITLSSLGASETAHTPWNNALRESVGKVNYAMDQMNQGKLGPTTKVTKNGVTRVIPTSLLAKARADGYQEVVS